MVSFHDNPAEPEFGGSAPTGPDPEELPRLQDWAQRTPPELRDRARTWISRPPPLDIRIAEPTYFLGPEPVPADRGRTGCGCRAPSRTTRCCTAFCSHTPATTCSSTWRCGHTPSPSPSSRPRRSAWIIPCGCTGRCDSTMALPHRGIGGGLGSPRIGARRHPRRRRTPRRQHRQEVLVRASS